MPVALCNTLYLSLLRKTSLAGPECGTMRIFKLKKSSNRRRIRKEKRKNKLDEKLEEQKRLEGVEMNKKQDDKDEDREGTVVAPHMRLTKVFDVCRWKVD
jgi:hypothetical protein